MALKILNGKTMTLPPIHMMIYGAAGSGKTQFITTCPKLFVIASSREQGIVNLMGKDVPYVMVDTIQDMEEAVEYVVEESAKGTISTAAIDSWTAHLDHVVRQIEVEVGGQMRTQDWGTMGRHAVWVMDRLRDAKCHVIYSALAQQDKDGATGIAYGDPMLFGKLARRLPGKCEIVGYIEATKPNKEQPKVHTLHLGPCGPFKGKCNIDADIPETIVLQRGHGWDYIEKALQGIARGGGRMGRPTATRNANARA